MHRHFKRRIMEQAERIHIEIEILQKKIDLWIRREHEIYYREAEKRINEKAIHFAQRWTYTDHQDLLSKLLIDVMVNYIAKDTSRPAHHPCAQGASCRVIRMREHPARP